MGWAGHKDVWGRGEVHTGFWWGNLREIEKLEVSGIDGRIILRSVFRNWDGGMDWIDLAQDWDRRRKLVKAAMKNVRIKPTSANRICESVMYFENLEVFEVYNRFTYLIY
jgi:hypothetical protein